MKLDIRADLKAIQKDLKIVSPLIQKSTVRALNCTIQHVQSQSVKAIANAISIPQKVIRQRARVTKANRWQLSATLKLNLFPIPLIKLNPKQTKRGVAAAKQHFPSAFMASMPSGHRGVFERVSQKRLPIQEIKIAIDPTAASITEQMLQASSSFFKRQLEQDLQWRLRP